MPGVKRKSTASQSQNKRAKTYGSRASYWASRNRTRSGFTPSLVLSTGADRVRIADPGRSREIHTFKRMMQFATLSTSISVEIDAGYSMQLSDLPNYAEFASLFDNYRFKQVTLRVIPDIRYTAGGSSTSYLGPIWHATAVDFDSNSAVSLNSIMQYDTCQIHDSLEPYEITFTPRPQMDNGGGPAFMATKGAWLDMANPSVSHFGILWSFPVNANNTLVFRVIAEYIIECIKTR